MMKNEGLTKEQSDDLIGLLERRFKDHMERHPQITWEAVKERLEAQTDKVWSLYHMEQTGGEPDVIAYDDADDTFLFCDCSLESPEGRRNVCYDPKALEDRKTHKPKHSAVGMAEEMGIELMDESTYRKLQRLGQYDTKTSSWVSTPEDIRRLGGALFCDRRYGQVFLYHNGASSYYGVRGFRGMVTL